MTFGGILGRLWLVPALILLTGASDGEEIGRAQKVVNQVWGGSLLYQLKPNQPVKFNEQINTSDDSGTTLAFLDQTVLSIGPNALVHLDGVMYAPGSEMLQGVMQVARGAMRFAGSATKKDLVVETPTMSIGIRGTIFNIVVSDTVTEIEVIEGQVIVTPAGAPALTLAQGEFLRGGTDGRPVKTAVPAAFRARFTALDRMLGPAPRPASAPGSLRAAPSSAPVVRTTIVTDTGGRPAGRFEEHADGRITALDASGSLRGVFDPVRQETRDSEGRVAGQGNRLRALLGVR